MANQTTSHNQAKSLALWCDVDSQVDLDIFTNKMALHINYWHFPFEKLNPFFSKMKKYHETPDILDLGLMVPYSKEINAISIYLPLSVGVESVEDISYLLKNKNIAKAIFNEPLKVDDDDIGDSFFSLMKADKKYCKIRRFPCDSESKGIDSSDLKFDSTSEGIILSITKKTLTTVFGNHADESAYFRLRIRVLGENKKAFFRSVSPNDKAYLSGYETTEFVDFRINESRLLPQTVTEKIKRDQKQNFLPINRIDFLLAAKLEADIDVTGTNKEFHKSRFLEPELWKSYFKGDSEDIADQITDGMLVYHWKKVTKVGEPFSDFTAFVKLKIRLSSNYTKLRYMSLAFLIGLCGSLVGSYLHSNLSSPLAMITTPPDTKLSSPENIQQSVEGDLKFNEKAQKSNKNGQIPQDDNQATLEN